MKKRILSLALALMLCLSLLPMAALAASEEPTADAVAAVQVLIDALPDADTITAENRADVQAQLTAIDDARLALDDDSALDCTRYQAAIAALNGLDDTPGVEVPVTLEGEAEHSQHCVCGATHSSIGNHDTETLITNWTPVSQLSDINSTGNYYLTGDVTLSKWTIDVDSNIVLCLNGYTLTADNADTPDTILVKGTLTITDCKGTGKITGTNTSSSGNHKVLVVSAEYLICTLNLYGGTIRGINVGDGYGGGVHNEGTFNMYGGTITGNTAKNGGGVDNFKNNGYSGPAKFNLYGGTIENNTASSNSASSDVHNRSGSTMNANGGTIGGGVMNNGTITRSDDATGYTTFNSSVTGDGTINDSAKVTVTFNSNGGSAVDSQGVLKGQKATKPTDPTKDGFTCVGWYEKNDAGAFKGTAFDFANTAITANITLYAKWECTAHNGGTATCTNKAVCDTCHEEYGEINAANHTALKHVEAKAATIEAEGNIEYWYCEDCGKYYSDKDCKNEIALADTVIAKLTPTATPAPKAPNTADEANGILWLALAMLSMMAVAVVARKKAR